MQRSCCMSYSVIVQVWEVLTVVDDNDLHFNNLRESHHQSQVKNCLSVKCFKSGLLLNLLVSFTIILLAVRLKPRGGGGLLQISNDRDDQKSKLKKIPYRIFKP